MEKETKNLERIKERFQLYLNNKSKNEDSDTFDSIETSLAQSNLSIIKAVSLGHDNAKSLSIDQDKTDLPNIKNYLSRNIGVNYSYTPISRKKNQSKTTNSGPRVSATPKKIKKISWT